MEILMSLQQYVRQVKPRNESYIPPVDKIQTFLTEGDTKEATLMENVIVACWNNKSLKKKDAFAKKIVKDSMKEFPVAIALSTLPSICCFAW